jgi:hypothetical protein
VRVATLHRDQPDPIAADVPAHKVGDRVEIRERTVSQPVVRWVERQTVATKPVIRTVPCQVSANAIKAFVVTKEGKLEPLAQAKLLDALAKPTRVLTGQADVDPRHLELIRAGTIYVVIQEPSRPQPPGEKQPEVKKTR